MSQNVASKIVDDTSNIKLNSLIKFFNNINKCEIKISFSLQ